MGFTREGKSIWMMGTPLPRTYAGFNPEPQASGKGFIHKLTLNDPIGDLAPGVAAQVANSEFDGGCTATWRFQVSGLSSEEGIMFSTSPLYGGVCAKETVIDILDDTDFGRVIVNAAKPRKVATTSFAPTERYDPDGPPAVYSDSSSPGTTIWGFRPDDYGLGDDWYRVRVRGAQRRHKGFKFLTGVGSTFTLAYQIVPFGIRHELNFLPQEPSQGETVTFEAEPVDPTKSALFEGYEWDFGDGSTHIYTQVATHSYATSGPFLVTLLVSNTGVTGVLTKFILTRQIRTFLNPITGLRFWGWNKV
jgi:hypothetical protein